MRRRRLTSALIATALACTGVLATSTASQATSGETCRAIFNHMGPEVPIRPGPYVSVGAHYTDCFMKLNTGGAQAIRALQKSLYGCYHQSDVASDGAFGPKTQAALKRVQKSLGITVDGIYGNETRDHMAFLVAWHGNEAQCAYDPYYPNNDVNDGDNNY